MNTPKITAISFDADGTLWDFTQVMRHALNRALDELRRHVPTPARPLTVETMIAIRNQAAAELKGQPVNMEDIRLAAFQKTLHHVGTSDNGLAAHLTALYLKHRFEDIRLFDDVIPSLDALQDRYTLGLLTNGNTYPDRCGLQGRFQFAVFAQDHGVEKPDPRLFQIALERAGCDNVEMLHVGDSLRDDVGGANGVGVRSVWLNRNRRTNNSGIQPDFKITSLTDLTKITQRTITCR